MAKLVDPFICVKQRKNDGCIPAGFEMLLRTARVSCIDFTAFQDNFNLRFSGKDNNFHSVAQSVMKKYSFVKVQIESWPRGGGDKKVNRIVELIAAGRPPIVSTSNPQGQGWHIMPAFGSDDQNILFFEPWQGVHLRFVKSDLIQVHDEQDGGHDIAWLDKQCRVKDLPNLPH